MEINELFGILGINAQALEKGGLIVRSPMDGAEIARLRTDSPADVENKVALADDAFLEEIGLAGFATLQDTENRSGSVFGLFGMPATLLIDAEGRVVGQHSGPLDWSDEAVRAELAAHLDG